MLTGAGLGNSSSFIYMSQVCASDFGLASHLTGEQFVRMPDRVPSLLMALTLAAGHLLAAMAFCQGTKEDLACFILLFKEQRKDVIS